MDRKDISFKCILIGKCRQLSVKFRSISNLLARCSISRGMKSPLKLRSFGWMHEDIKGCLRDADEFFEMTVHDEASHDPSFEILDPFHVK